MFIPGFSPVIGTLNAYRLNVQARNQSLERLSTGKRINRTADDPSGMIAADGFSSAIIKLNVELKKLQRMDAVAQTADGTLTEIVSMLRQAEGLEHINANESGLTSEEKEENQHQVDEILVAIENMVAESEFNGQKLFDGNLRFKSHKQEYRLILHNIGSMDGTTEERLASLEQYRKDLTRTRGELGSYSNHVLQGQQNSIRLSIENLSSAESLIRDTDMAEESAKFVRAEMLVLATLKALEFMKSSAEDILKLIGEPLKSLKSQDIAA